MNRKLQSVKLPAKLIAIREGLNLNEAELINRLGFRGILGLQEILGYEKGTIQPPLLVLLEYGRIAGVCLDTLVDDRKDLPKKLPGKPQHGPSRQ